MSADVLPAGDAWARVQREIADLATQSPEQLRRSLHQRACALLLHHVRHSRNPAYRDLINETGLDPTAVDPTDPTALDPTGLDWQRVPVIDKQWLASAGYHRQPAVAGPTLIVSTSGSTAAQVLVPVTPECANRGLGDNFLRTLAMSGVGPDQRHWGIEHRPPGADQGVTGSSISMQWLARHCGPNALVTAATDPLDEQLRRAAEFQPDTIGGSPGFLQQIARTPGATLRPRLLVYGGAALADTDADRLRAGFPGVRLTAFYPTTDAGAVGVSPADDGVYVTFSETHLVEVLDDQNQPVATGARGDVVVTQFDALAAPIIRYRVGDQATYLGWDGGRLLLSGIERAAEAAIGSTLVPYGDLRTWAPKLAQHDPSVVAVQLVRTYSAAQHREQPVIRVIGTASPGLATAARALIDDLPQLTAEIASGELGQVLVEFRDPPPTLAGHWKIPLYVDERVKPTDPPCPSDLFCSAGLTRSASLASPVMPPG